MLPALKAMQARYGDASFTRYGFVDAFNPTFPLARPETVGRRRRSGRAGSTTNYLGIDQGPIVLMAENHRSGLVWKVMKKNPHIVRGLCRAGFTGGWIEGRCR